MDVSAIIAKAKAKYQPTQVEKEFPLEYDLGNLAAFDSAPIETRSAKALHALSRDNVQLMVNALWDLPSVARERATLVKLPDKNTRLPRARRPPKPRLPTRWETFAAIKGIQKKRKRSKLVYDEELDEYVPRYGYKSKKNREAAAEWMVELKDGDNAHAEEVFSRRKQAKNARIAKQKQNEERNMDRKAGISRKGSSGVVRTKRGKKGGKSKAATLPGANSLVSQMQGERLDTADIRKSISIQAISTASYGKFDNKLRNQRKSSLKKGKQKKMPVSGSKAAEKSTAAKIADRVLRKKHKVEGTVDMSRAVNMYQVMHDRERQAMNDQTYKARAEQRKMSKSKGRR